MDLLRKGLYFFQFYDKGNKQMYMSQKYFAGSRK